MAYQRQKPSTLTSPVTNVNRSFSASQHSVVVDPVQALASTVHAGEAAEDDVNVDMNLESEQVPANPPTNASLPSEDEI